MSDESGPTSHGHGGTGETASGVATGAGPGTLAGGSGGSGDRPFPVPGDEPRRRRHRPRRGLLGELPFLGVLALVLALLIKAFLVQAFYIPSGSMENTLQVKDRVLVNKLVYDFRGPHRGEIVVFNGLDSWTSESEVPPPANGLQKVLRKVSGALGVGAPGEKDFIKRVIGVPGDRVACCADGHVTVQQPGHAPVALDEPYLFEDNHQSFCAAVLTQPDPQSVLNDPVQSVRVCPSGAPGILVPAGRLFVMGDHRGSSYDSRGHISSSSDGTVPEDKVVGRAFVKVWPFGHAGFLRVPGTFQALGVPADSGVQAAPYGAGVLLALPVAGLRRRRRRRVA